MMKKYNKPEIVTLALDMVDVIETSSLEASAILTEKGYGSGEKNQTLTISVNEMSDNWSW